MIPAIKMSHRNVKPHVRINEAACCQTERTLVGCADPVYGGLCTLSVSSS